jgi:hypothetical protein
MVQGQVEINRRRLLDAAKDYANAAYGVDTGSIGWQEQLAKAHTALMRLGLAAIAYDDALVMKASEHNL